MHVKKISTLRITLKFVTISLTHTCLRMHMPCFPTRQIAMVMANTIPSTYAFYFKGFDCAPEDYSHGNYSHDDHADDDHRRKLATSHNVDLRRLAGSASANCPRFLLSDCTFFGHPATLHFLANDVLMCFHFGLAMKVCPCLMVVGWLSTRSYSLQVNV